MNRTLNPSSRLAKLQLPVTPFLIEKRRPRSSSSRSKRLSNKNTFVAMGTLSLLCLLSCSFFIPAQYRSFCEQNPSSNLCRNPFGNQFETAPPALEFHAAIAPANPVIATVNATPETASPKLEMPLQPAPSSKPSIAVNVHMPEITEGAHSPFALQIGAYQWRAEAEKQVAQLKRKVETARIIKVEIPNKGFWYRVQLGSFTECAEAIRYGQQLQAEKMLAEFIITDYQNPGQ